MVSERIIQILSAFTDATREVDFSNPLGKAEMLYEQICRRYPSNFYGYFQPVLEYFEKNVIPHKIAVFESGISLLRMEKIERLVGHQNLHLLMTNLWEHDLSKFSEREAPYYAYHNFKDPAASIVSQPEFEAAWHHHKVNNPHHPEYWWSVNRFGKAQALPMPVIYQVEMVADWIGAGKTYGSTLEQWLPANLHKFRFHPETSKSLLMILRNIGYNARFVSNRKTRLYTPII